MSCDLDGEKVELKPLPYPFEDYEPIILKGHIQFLHTQTHKLYVRDLNMYLTNAYKALEGPEYNDDQIRVVKEQILYNGGGHLNHKFFWESIAPIAHGGGIEPGKNSDLRQSINKAFGSWDNFY